MIKDFSKKLFVGITGWQDRHWKEKLTEIKKFGITEAALFLERFNKVQRREIYQALDNSGIKRIPLVHIKNDMGRDELKYLCEKYNYPYLTIHEDSFNYLHKWRGFYKHLFLETDFNNRLADCVDVNRVGGFCVDLSHFKAAEEKWSKEFEYIDQRKKTLRNFRCNHLNGYSYEKNCDIHTIKDIKEFDYLKTLPKFVFGDVIGIEAYNSIEEQLKFKKYLVRMLNKL